MTIFWFSVFVFMLIVEFTTVNLVSLWFAVGAICSMFVSMFTDSFLFQLGAFSIISLLTIIITKPLVKKFKGFEVEATNTDRVIGKIADVTKEVGTVTITAKLEDAIVTYVNGKNAYIQDADAGILIYQDGHGLVAGNKINGVISGKATSSS